MLILRWFVFLVGAYLTNKYATQQWFGGAFFGGAVVIWHWSFAKRIAWLRYGAFLVVATAIYALVVELAQGSWPENLFFKIIAPSVVTGSILLPLAHHFILEAKGRFIIAVIPILYGVTYIAGHLLDVVALVSPLSQWIHVIAVWQATYLVLLFRDK